MEFPIVYILNIRAVYMENEIYRNNNGHFREALTQYGTIASLYTSVADEKTIPGALDFKEYFLANSELSQANAAMKSNFYPGPPIIIDGSLLVDINTIEFNNNYKQELSTINNYE